MKRIINALWIGFFASVLAVGAISCKKISPNDTSSLPSASFTLSAVEDRYAPFNYDWTISRDGRTDSVREQIDDMYVTHYNKLTLVVTPTGAGFQGVNVTTSNPEAVRITKIDQTHYDLSYLKDGEADISVFNGSRKDEYRITFHIAAKHEIFPTAVVFLYDEGTEREKEIRATEWFIDEQQDFKSYYIDFINYHKPLDYRVLYYQPDGFHIVMAGSEEGAMPPRVLHSLRFLRVEPENTSFRTLSFASSTYNIQALEGWKDYLSSQGLSTDWWESWSGDLDDFERVCYLAVIDIPGYINGLTMSLCELSLMCNSPTGSSRCQTAVLSRLDTSS